MLNIYDYIANSKYYKTFRVDDLIMVEYKCMLAQDRVMFWTPVNYFSYILTGEAVYYEGEKEHVVASGEAMFVRKGAYIGEQHRKGDYCALVIFLTDDFIQKVVDKYRVAPQVSESDASTKGDSIFPMAIDESLRAYFHSVLSYFSKDSAPAGELLKLKFEELVLNILAGGQHTSLVTCLHSIRDNGKICIRETMEKSFMFPMSLDEYARLCARSLSTFKSDFQLLYNSSPGRWLIRKRLQYARILLETTKDSVGNVAARSGFKNTAHFVKVFKDAYGIPPLQYRLKEAALYNNRVSPIAIQ